MRQQSFARVALSPLAAAILTLGLVSCATATEPGSPSGAGEKSGASTESPSPASNTDCDWDAPRLPVVDPVVPAGQQGDLAAITLGSWQITHFDLGLGNGMEAWEAETDMRYVFANTGDLRYCVDGLGGVNRSEMSESYTVDGLDIALGNGAGFTAVAWSTDSLLLNNPADDSLSLFIRR